MSTGEWRLAATSAIGSSHLTTEKPCEDAHSFEFIGGDSNCLVLCVSDGAGTATKGKDGAEFVCKHFPNFVKNCIESGMPVDDFTAESVKEWLESVRTDLQEIASLEETILRDYSATVVAGVIGENCATLLQIGDGAIVTKFEGQDCFEPAFWPEQGEYANQTVFVTSDNAEASLTVTQHLDSKISEIALFSDGLQRLCLHYATRSAHGPFFNRFFSELNGLEPGHSKTMSSALEQFLISESVLERTDDDKTLILASRRPN